MRCFVPMRVRYLYWNFKVFYCVTGINKVHRVFDSKNRYFCRFFFYCYFRKAVVYSQQFIVKKRRRGNLMTTNWPIMGSGKNLTNPPSTLGDPKQDTVKSLINYVITSRWPLYRTHPHKDCVAGKRHRSCYKKSGHTFFVSRECVVCIM